MAPPHTRGLLCVALAVAAEGVALQARLGDDVLASDASVPELGGLDESLIDAELAADFKAKSEKLKAVTKELMEVKKEMEDAKVAANVAMKKVREEAVRRRAAFLAEQEMQRKAEEEQRRAKEEAVARARAVVGPALDRVSQFLQGSHVTVERLADVLVSLPSVIQNEKFMQFFHAAMVEIEQNVNDFLNITARKTSRFVGASASASDEELSPLMAKFLHEAGYRLQALHRDTARTIEELRFTMPDDLKKALGPILVSIKQNAVLLKVNATGLANAIPAEACKQVSEIGDYSYKLLTIGAVIQSVTSSLLPDMSNVMHMPPNVTKFTAAFLNMAQLEVAGLQEASHNIVMKVGPIVDERIQCTWSAAHPRFGLDFLAAGAVLVASWSLL